MRWSAASARNWRAFTAFTFFFMVPAVSSREYPCPNRSASTCCCSEVNCAYAAWTARFCSRWSTSAWTLVPASGIESDNSSVGLR
ncbi:MAG: hypothetical protein MZV64_17880 [Ignavibacteriales bacterium]|nr:hypothetical protein [Ignavibacteriales bacterium]